MSLISDALKRARQEAARQDSLRQGVPYAMGVADPPVRRTPWISLLAGLGAGCILAAAVFALAFFAGWGPFHKPTVETRTAEIPAAVAPPSPAVASISESAAPAQLPAVPLQEKAAPAPPPKPVPEPPRVLEERRPAPQVETTPPVVVRRPPPETVPAAPAPAPAPITEVERPAPAPVPVAPTSAAPAENPGSLVEGQAYTGEVPVPGGGSLKLNGIVFSQDHPIAVLNGRVMGPGESVQGFTVVTIESGRVKLQGHGTTVYLSPK